MSRSESPGSADHTTDATAAVYALGYGLRNHVVDVIEEAAPLTIGVAPEDIFDHLPSAAMKAWVSHSNV